MEQSLWGEHNPHPHGTNDPSRCRINGLFHLKRWPISPSGIQSPQAPTVHQAMTHTLSPQDRDVELARL
uniref:Uncharacterized protein n=1 Tax=Oryza meridionalis TaxID=40149 RepID=A0A0E0D2E5_9ORYZ